MSMVGSMAVLTLANPLFVVAVPIMIYGYYRMQQVRETPSWPRGWANCSLLLAVHPQKCMGQPNTFVAAVLHRGCQRDRAAGVATGDKVIFMLPCILH
jgi:hypothetical protein